jgi:hypothetical protein
VVKAEWNVFAGSTGGRAPATTAAVLREWAGDVAMGFYTAALHK